jgi:peroxiredoxin
MLVPTPSSFTSQRLRRLGVSNTILIFSATIALLFLFMALKQNTKLERDNFQMKLTLKDAARGMMVDWRAQVGDILPSFEANTLAGKRVSIAYNGKCRYILVFFSPQCGTCLSQVSTWNQIAKRIEAPRTKMLGVSRDSLEITKAAMGSQSFELVTLDDMAVVRAYRADVIPLVLFVSEDGHIEWLHYGPLTESKTNELLSKLSVSSNPG